MIWVLSRSENFDFFAVGRDGRLLLNVAVKVAWPHRIGGNLRLAILSTFLPHPVEITSYNRNFVEIQKIRSIPHVFQLLTINVQFLGIISSRDH